MVMANKFELDVIKNENIQHLNNYLEPFIDEFLQEKKLSSNDTYKNYLSDFNNTFKDLFNYENYKYVTKNDLEKLSVEDLIKYRFKLINIFDEYGERKYSNATINRRIASLKSLIKYLKLREKIEYETDKLKLLKALRNESEEIEVIPMNDALKILNYFEQRKNGLSIYLATKLAIDTGLRAREILTLTWGQFYPNEKSVIIKSKGKIKGKGNKDWEKEISINLYNELLQLKKTNTDKVFNICYSTLAKAMNEAVEKLNFVNRKYTFHSFRKCAARNTYELTKDILITKKFLNHDNLNTTQKYVGEKSCGIVGVFSLADSIDKELYKKVDKEVLIEVIEKLEMTHVFNIEIDGIINKK